MKDRHFSVPLPPPEAAYRNLSISGANALEINLKAIYSGLEVFDVELPIIFGVWGYVQKDEEVSLGATVKYATQKIISIIVSVTGAEQLSLSGVGWRVSDVFVDGVIAGKKAVHAYGDDADLTTIMAALKISIHDTRPALDAYISLSAVSETGWVFYAQNQSVLKYRDAVTWILLKHTAPFWGGINGYTWREIEAQRKSV